MFESMTYEKLLTDALAQVSDKIDKREGAIIYDAIAPMCCELAKAYADLEITMEQMFPQTAAKKYLLLHAQQRGFAPKAADYLEIIMQAEGENNCNIPIGARFNMDKYNFILTENLGQGKYRLVCETAGSKPNKAISSITPINYLSGITACSVVEIAKSGTDEEDIEVFRKRFLEAICQPRAFGGNVSDYRTMLKAMNGVGQVKIFTADSWKGAGTVGVCITDENNNAPTAEFLGQLQNYLDPPHAKGKGLGVVPIGHKVDVCAAEVYDLNIDISVKISDSSVDEDEIKAQIETAVERLIAEKNKKWEQQRVGIYASQIVAEIMDITGVVDVSSVTIDDEMSYIGSDFELLGINLLEVSVSYV